MSEISIGKIVKPQGILGEMKVFSYIDDTETFSMLKKVRLSNETEYRDIEKVRVQGEFAFLKLSGIDNRNDVEMLRYKELVANKEEIKELLGDEDMVLASDVIGMSVCGLNYKGTLKEIVNYGATDIATLELNGKECMVPLLNELVEHIDEANKQIFLNQEKFDEVVVWQDEN